jgi:mannose-6-phosphate isomerase
MTRMPLRAYRLENPIQPYDWGSASAIPTLLGRPSSGTPVAELWMGAHPKAPSLVRLDDEVMPLNALIHSDPAAILGPEVAARFAGQLPFLFKVLAADRALSIQAHPDRAQAREGFARENARGLPLDAPTRNYRDPHHKPELICALSTFWGLNGFRSPNAIHAQLARLCPHSLGHLLAGLQETPQALALEGFFQGLMRLAPALRPAVIAEALDHARPRVAQDPVCRWIVEIQRLFPEDVAMLAPAYLHLVRLEPGEAMYLPAGQLHAYLQGVGLEVMANSDNVLRGGLTAKHIDLSELLRVLRFSPAPPRRVAPTTLGPGEACYATPAEEFLLSIIEPLPGRVFNSSGERGPEILLCLEGQARLEGVQGNAPLDLVKGDALLIPAALTAYRIAGEARIYRASVPRPFF